MSRQTSRAPASLPPGATLLPPAVVAAATRDAGLPSPLAAAASPPGLLAALLGVLRRWRALGLTREERQLLLAVSAAADADGAADPGTLGILSPATTRAVVASLARRGLLAVHDGAAVRPTPAGARLATLLLVEEG